MLESHNLFSIRKLDIIKAHQYAIDACEKNSDMMLYIVAKHIRANIIRDWYYLDKFVMHLKKLWPKMRTNELITSDKSLISFLKQYIDLPDELIPSIIYLNGFEKDI